MTADGTSPVGFVQSGLPLFPPTLSVLHITAGFSINSPLSMPNRWHRFWYRVLLGWTWSKP